ncbi:MAG: sel1 repeat family protein [Bradyrhizobium sp.]|nr:sel1 repeat family protein [Bradyrhizobium sp.]
MRTSEHIIAALMLGTALVAAPAFAFDGAPVNQRDTAIPVVSGPPAALTKPPAASAQDSFKALEYAADIDGYAVAQWKLGRMYAAGDGVVRNDLRAFDYFSRIAKDHAQDSPSSPQAALVANAFVALARYYLNGIPNSSVKSDPDRAREMLYYAASYFGSADAQFDLARLYLKTANASANDLTYGTRWLGLAASKGQRQAQAMLGQMLFSGDRLPPQRARGLMWMALASDGANNPDEAWIKDSYNQALSRASEDDRAMAAQMLKYWLQGRHD